MTEGLILGVVGGRDFSDADLMREMLLEVDPERVVSGGARGADRLAANVSKRLGIPLIEYLPDWKTYGKGAAFRRNALIVAASTHLVAFWDGKSKGTKNSIEQAEKKGIPVLVVPY